MNIRGTYTQTPNTFFDLLPQMSGNVSKVVMVYFRQSFGFQKDFAFISHREFKEMTGIRSTATVSSAIRQALQKGFMYADNTTIGKNGAQCYRVGYKFFTDADYYQNRNESVTELKSKITSKIKVNQDQITSKIEAIVKNEITLKIEVPKSEITLKTEAIDDQITSKIEVHINKEVLKEKEKNKKNKKIKTLAAPSADPSLSFSDDSDNTTLDKKTDVGEMLDSLLADIPEPDEPVSEIEESSENAFEDMTPSIADQTKSSEIEQVIEADTITDFSDKPFTQAEYEYFVVQRKYSLKWLTDLVYCPIEWDFGDKDICNPCWMSRIGFQTIRVKKLNDWQKAVGLVEQHFPVSGRPEATSIAKQLLGKVDKGERLKYQICPGMDIIELCAFVYWLDFMKEQNIAYRPRKAEKVHALVQEFRALPNMFEHLNFAQYNIRTFFEKPAEEIIYDEPESVDSTETLAELEKLWEDQFGFKLFEDNT